MPAALKSLDYKPDVRPTKTATVAASGAFRAEDFAAVEEFLNLLARAVRQFHTYPSTSPLCSDAIAACHKVYATLERRDRLVLRAGAGFSRKSALRGREQPRLHGRLGRRHADVRPDLD